MFKKTLISLALAAALAPCVASAQNAIATEGPWLVRVRAAYMLNDNSNETTLSLGQIEVEDRWIPEFDITYFFTDNIAVELVLTWPQKMDVTLAGTDVGSVKPLPPTLSSQYHFMPNEPLRPYVGNRSVPTGHVYRRRVGPDRGCLPPSCRLCSPMVFQP
jgi:outer membrane protein